MRQTSIQRRLIAAVVISQLLLAIGIVSVAVYFTRRQLRNAFDAGLHGRAMSIAALVRYSEDEHPKLIFEDDLVPPPLEKQHPDLYQVIDWQWTGARPISELAAGFAGDSEKGPATRELHPGRRSLSRGAAGERSRARSRRRCAFDRCADGDLCGAHGADDPRGRMCRHLHCGWAAGCCC